MVLVDSKRGGVENHCKEVLTDLSRLCWEENHCNLTFICTADGTEIHAHVYLLSQVSSIINQAATQFYQHHHGHMHVTLDGIDSPTLGTLIEFLYLGGTTMSHKAADNLYVLCEMLAIDIDQSKITVTGETTRSATPAQEERPKTAKSTKRPSSSSSPKNKKSSKSVALYCYCRQPSSKDLLGCDFCPEWYHPRCLNISQAEARKLVKQDTWRCPECIKKLSPSKKQKGKGSSPDLKIEQLDGENSFRLTPIKTELLSDDEWSSKKEFRVDIQPLEKWGEKKGLVQMDKETYRVWHNAETPTPSPPPSPRARSLETKKNLIYEEVKEVKDKGEDVVKSKVKIEMEADGEMCNDDNDNNGGSGKKDDVSVLKDAREDMKKLLQNRSRGMHRPVKRERPSFESMLGEIAAKDLEEIKEKRAKMSMTSSNIKGQIGETKVKIKDREKSSGHHKSRSSDSKREKFEENAKSTSPYKRTMQLSSRKSSKKSAFERDTDMNWDLSSETEEVNRPVEDAKQSPEKESSTTSADYDELFFCYICKSIYVTKGALDNHIKNAH